MRLFYKYMLDLYPFLVGNYTTVKKLPCIPVQSNQVQPSCQDHVAHLQCCARATCGTLVTQHWVSVPLQICKGTNKSTHKHMG